MRRAAVAAALGLVAALAGCSGATTTIGAPPPPIRVPAPALASPTIDVALRPVCVAGATPAAIDVRIVADGPDSDAPPVFRISNPKDAEAIQKLIEGLAVTDDRGPFPLDPSISVGRDRETRLYFHGGRPSQGKLEVRYRVRSVATTEPGIRFGLRHDETSIGGTGDGMLLLPATAGASDISIRWITDGCDPSWAPASAVGIGPGPHALHAPPDALRQAGFFFGRPVTIAHDIGSTRLRFYLYGGKVAFDAQVLAKYTADILHAERAVFGDEDPTPFYAFMRVLPEFTTKVNGGGNLYGYTSVVGPGAEWNPRMRNHLAHELMHHWIGVGLWIADAQKVSGYWFTEGFTVRYARTVALRTGSISPQEYLDEVNRHAKSYYGSTARAASNAEIERGVEDGTGHGDLGLLPYYKGGLYADELDGAIRTKSAGKRSLDDVMRELLALAKTAPRNAAGYRQLDEEVFRSAIDKELGAEGVARFDAVIRQGAIARPGPDALGPCFARKDVVYGDLEGYEWVRRPDVADARCGLPE